MSRRQVTIDVDAGDWQNRDYRRAVMRKSRQDAKRERCVYRIVMVRGRIRQLMATIDAR